jgi:hypothetical protein
MRNNPKFNQAAATPSPGRVPTFGEITSNPNVAPVSVPIGVPLTRPTPVAPPASAQGVVIPAAQPFPITNLERKP